MAKTKKLPAPTSACRIPPAPSVPQMIDARQCQVIWYDNDESMMEVVLLSPDGIALHLTLDEEQAGVLGRVLQDFAEYNIGAH